MFIYMKSRFRLVSTFSSNNRSSAMENIKGNKECVELKFYIQTYRMVDRFFNYNFMICSRKVTNYKVCKQITLAYSRREKQAIISRNGQQNMTIIGIKLEEVLLLLNKTIS